jgi:hypothetical protein
VLQQRVAKGHVRVFGKLVERVLDLCVGPKLPMTLLLHGERRDLPSKERTLPRMVWAANVQTSGLMFWCSIWSDIDQACTCRNGAGKDALGNFGWTG